MPPMNPMKGKDMDNDLCKIELWVMILEDGMAHTGMHVLEDYVLYISIC